MIYVYDCSVVWFVSDMVYVLYVSSVGIECGMWCVICVMNVLHVCGLYCGVWGFLLLCVYAMLYRWRWCSVYGMVCGGVYVCVVWHV